MIYEFDNVVVGSSLSALLFAFCNQYPVIFTEPEYPFRFDFIDCNTDLEFLKLTQITKRLNTFSETFDVGTRKILLWERLLFLLSLDSKVILSDLCDSMRCNGDKIVCSNEYSKIAEIRFDTCHYFYDKNAKGFVKENPVDNEMFLCYDWIAFNRGGKHNIDYFETGDNFVNKIWFYSSDRIDGNTPIKDACTLSILSRDELQSFDYSETTARFKLIHEMEARGMKGLFNGYGSNGKPKYYKFRTSSISRKTSRIEYDLRTDSPNIKIQKCNEKDLLSRLSQASLGYDRFLRHL